MALAVWEITDPEEPFEDWAPRSERLRLVPEPTLVRPGTGRCRDHEAVEYEEERGRPRSVQSGAWSEGTSSRRPACRPRSVASVRTRRLRVVAGLFVLAVAVLLALPVQAWAGQASGSAPAGLVGSSPGHPSVYVVQPGDTLWSIATRLDRGGDPRPLVSQLAQETGSSTVVPGEHIVLPG